MTGRKDLVPRHTRRVWMHWCVCAILCLFSVPARAQLFSNLQALVYQFPVGPLATPQDGPKGIASADFDGDGKLDLALSNTDGSVAVCFGTGTGRFGRAIHLHGGAGSLRGIVCADFDGDGRPDIAAAAPFKDRIVFFFYRGNRSFSAATTLAAWNGVRNLAAGDFDGDGLMDLAAAGPNNGLRQYRGLGSGAFAAITNLTALDFSFSEATKFPKPVYSLKVFRPAGATRDQLVATHAETNRIWMVAPSSNGIFQVQGSITSLLKSHALNIGPLLTPADSFLSDLVSVQRDAGTLEIHAAASGTNGFESTPRQRIDVPGGPRAVEIVDLNGDGWNDLIVVQRNFDSIVTFVNINGTFHPATERPVGSSPREMVAQRFDDDEYFDLAVMNRGSADVSVLLAYPQEVGYRGVDHLYLVDGNVAGLAVFDFNGDGYDDVIQLHRASGDFSVRLLDPSNFTLMPPVFYTVGNVPAAQVVVDVNHDGLLDQITANLGTLKIERSSVSVRLNNGDGTFGQEQRYYLPDTVEGRLFALVPGDFDGDGNIDLAAGFLDSNIAFFRGDGFPPDTNSGNHLTYQRSQRFVTQARGLIAADFDQDGDLDLAGVGVSGEMWVIENRGDLMTGSWIAGPAEAGTPTNIQIFPAPETNSFSTRTIIATTNNNGYTDLVIGSGNGAWHYTCLGPPGIRFASAPQRLPGTPQSVSGILVKDLDGDGVEDLVASCRDFDCMSVFTRLPDGRFAFVQTLDAPASRFIATGDLDGDGLPDLVGSGRILWTALSSHANSDTPPLTLAGQRRGLTNLVINEFLAINSSLPVDRDGDRFSEWIELYNAGANDLPMNGWRLRYTATGENPLTKEFAMPPTFFIRSGHHGLLICSETNRSPYHTGFKLSGDGGTLALINPAGVEVDRVSYPPQQEAVSYARFKDGLRSFVFNPYPTPERPNVASGLVEPVLKFNGVEPTTFQPGMTNRIFAQVQADVGVSSLSMYYQLLGDASSRRVIQLYDDGLHGDGVALDGLFGGDLIGAFSPGAEIEFYFEVTDLNDQTVQVPDEVEFARVGQAGTAFQLAFGPSEPPRIELSEIVPLNMNTLTDEANGTPDWVEVRNVSGAPLSLDGLALCHQIGESDRYYFPTGKVLMPGEHLVVYCDNNAFLGPLHAPLRLNASGDMIMLTGTTTNHSRSLIDWYQFGSTPADQAHARVGAGGRWHRMKPTPNACNVSTWLGLVETNPSEPAEFTFAFATTTNGTYTVEHTLTLGLSANWQPIETFYGDGIEKVVSRPLANAGFFRVRFAQ